MDVELIKKTAQAELEHEIFRRAVAQHKERLRKKKSLWDIIFPWKIIIVRKQLD